MEYAVIKSLKIFEFDLFNFKFSRDENIAFDPKPSNLLWKTFTQYVKDNKILSIDSLDQVPDWFRIMINNPLWKQKMY